MLTRIDISKGRHKLAFDGPKSRLQSYATGYGFQEIATEGIQCSTRRANAIHTVNWLPSTPHPPKISYVD